jgi:hypothetical protein
MFIFSLMQNSTVIVPLSNQKVTSEFAVECHQSQKAIPWEAIGFRLDFHLAMLPDKTDENNGNEQGNCLRFINCLFLKLLNLAIFCIQFPFLLSKHV